LEKTLCEHGGKTYRRGNRQFARKGVPYRPIREGPSIKERGVTLSGSHIQPKKRTHIVVAKKKGPGGSLRSHCSYSAGEEGVRIHDRQERKSRRKLREAKGIHRIPRQYRARRGVASFDRGKEKGRKKTSQEEKRGASCQSPA